MWNKIMAYLWNYYFYLDKLCRIDEVRKQRERGERAKRRAEERAKRAYEAMKEHI